MSPLQPLREFIRQRLTAAAEEIFSEVEKTIVRLEEELDAQRRMTGINWRAEIKISRIDQQKLLVHNQGEVLTDPKLQNQQESSGLDQEEPEPLQVQQEPEPSETVVWDQDETKLLDVCWDQQLNRTNLEKSHDSIKKEAAADHEEARPAWIQEQHMGADEVKQEADFSSLEHEQQDTSQKGDLNEEPGSGLISCRVSAAVGSDDEEGSGPVQSRRRSWADAKKMCFQCDVCGSTLKTKSNLNRHYKTHTGERPFCCETCGKCFTQYSHLASHKKIHSGVKPFCCETCGKRFLRMSDLNAHKVIHTDEKPLCWICGKRFTKKAHLREHKKTHGPEAFLTCETCGKSFPQIHSLIAHKNIHSSFL